LGSNGRILNNLGGGDRRAPQCRSSLCSCRYRGVDSLWPGTLGPSYITGYGSGPTSPADSAVGTTSISIPPPPPGALAGGRIPAGADFPTIRAGLPQQCCYLDEPTSRSQRRIIRWNATSGLVGHVSERDQRLLARIRGGTVRHLNPQRRHPTEVEPEVIWGTRDPDQYLLTTRTTTHQAWLQAVHPKRGQL
jgi:hypothetical protein